MGAYVVLGGTGAVGSALVGQLIDAGNRVMVGARDPEKLCSLAERWGCERSEVRADDSQSVDACVESANEKFGQVDGVVNCMGSVLLKPAHLVSDEQWHETLAANLSSSFYLARAAAKQMRGRGGSMVFVSSAAARHGIANHEAIAAAKAGVEGLAISLAATYASRGIRVNAVAPGLVKSQMTRSLWEPAASAKASAAMHPLGRLGEPSEVAELIAWLLQPTAGWVTGQVIGIDGGLGSLTPRR
ncbi:SDR family NAD(P)-dependent oxidoreductase [Allorhodopirellula solitaria]|uniref:3-oxoacyl-[acyl-carrier-protein] reductase FabG n=1 Tax=Allorhodopirellula solitaria TaxID=2527987 RepID=A0A5C5X113_9BACT|nr:SDR family oxidoreductase [Allorhodopirellula solitaria]TWT56636.1 3-oxoacyl-[acyl-carrier-protein] reductase FabG [Allorhodopirellula solitaria]